MASDDIMIVNCADTKHCVPDAPELPKVTDSNPKHAVKVGDGMRLDVSVIGDMRTEINTVAPATREEQASMHNAVEEIHLNNVLVVPR
jgi:hypothetical protein